MGKDEQVYVALLSFIANNPGGEAIVISAGQRVRAGDLTRRFAGWFIEESADDFEIAEARTRVAALGY